MKIGLCLPGGANKGSWIEGVVTALRGRGLEFDLIAGTSIGGVVGAMNASGMSEEQRWWWWENLTWGKVTNMRFPPIIAGLFGDSFYSDEKMKKLFREELPSNFEDLEVPLAVTACDIASGCKGDSNIIIQNGDLDLALRATTAIPGIFPPVRAAGKVLVDGGIGNYVAVEIFGDFDLVIVLIAGYGQPREQPHKALEIVWRSFDVFQQEELRKEVICHVPPPTLIPVWNRHPEILESTIFDWTKGADWLRMGYEDGLAVPIDAEYLKRG